MEFDQGSLEKLRRMDDGTLRALAAEIASAAGADPARAEAMLSDPSVLRNALRGLTPEQANALLAGAGEDRARRIAELMKKKGF